MRRARTGSAGAGAAVVAGVRRLTVAFVLVGLIVTVCVVNPSFASLENFRDLLVQSAPVVIVGCAMTLVILVGEIDISAGSLLGLLAALLGILSSPRHLGLPAPMVIPLILFAGMAVGTLNGLLVTVGRVPSIVATLGMLTILRGITELVLGGVWITDLPPSIRFLGTGAIAGVPMCIWVGAVVASVFLVVTRLAPLGMQLRAVGGNAQAAAFSRIPVTRVKLVAFALVGLMTGVAALFSVTQQSVIESGIGAGFELVVITAVVVGGTSIRGGVGGIGGTVLAALLLGSIRTALVFLNVGEAATFWERAIHGVFILAAVLVDHFAGAERRRGEGFGAPA